MARRNTEIEMAKRNSDTPMVMQPVAHDLTAATQMLPIMPTPAPETKPPAAARKIIDKKPPNRTEAVRAAKAKITRRNSLRKQREAQRKSG